MQREQKFCIDQLQGLHLVITAPQKWKLAAFLSFILFKNCWLLDFR